jgi:hypothetical protein
LILLLFRLRRWGASFGRGVLGFRTNMVMPELSKKFKNLKNNEMNKCTYLLSADKGGIQINCLLAADFITYAVDIYSI